MNATLTGPFGGSACYRPREGPRQGCPRTARPAPGRDASLHLAHPRELQGPSLCSARPDHRVAVSTTTPPAHRATGAASAHLQIGAPVLGGLPWTPPLGLPLPSHSCAAAPHPARGTLRCPSQPLPLQLAEADAQAQRGPCGLTGKASRRRGGQLVSSSPAGTCRAVLGVSNLDGDRAARRLPPACVPRSGMPRVRAPGAAARTPRTTRGPRGLGRAGQSPEAPDV